MICFAISKRWAGLLAAGCLALSTACSSGGAAGPGRSITELTNPFLRPEYSSWMVGAASRLATPEEIRAYLALRDDAQAAAFIEEFWAKRDPTPDRPDNAIRTAFEQRSAEADRLFSESGYLGRYTDRGALFVLFGPPTKVDFEVSPTPDLPPIELWSYGPDAPSGINGQRPAGYYRFLKRGDLTTTYIPGQVDPRLRRRPAGPPARY